MKDISTIGKKTINTHGWWNYAIKENTCYYADGSVYAMDLLTGKKQLLLADKEAKEKENQKYEEIFITEDALYTENSKSIIEILLDSKQIKNYPLGKISYPIAIESIDNKKLLVLDGVTGILYQLNRKTGKNEKISRIYKASDGAPCFTANSKLKNGYFYCNDDYGDIFKVDYNKKANKKVVDLKKFMNKGFSYENTNFIDIGYCDNYIAIQVNYEVKDSQSKKEINKNQLLIFTYDGKLKKLKELNQLT